MVLLENHNAALPIPSSGNIATFGVGSYRTVKGGQGSGEVNQRYTTSIRQGLETAGYTVTTSPTYWNALSSFFDTTYGNWNTGGLGNLLPYANAERPLTAETVQPTAPTDTALYVIARGSAEGADITSGAGNYLLTATERANIELIGHQYENVIVMLNTGSVMDSAFYDQVNATVTDPDGGLALDSLLLISQPGQEAGNAVVDVLKGAVVPSGKLTDSWASQYSYNPASALFGGNGGGTAHEEYTEGIYVGYRYFDSFYQTIGGENPADSVINYPFGYGLSYTDFDVQPLAVTADTETVTVRARVTNTGDTFTGREVVQAYFSAPETGIDKPYQELAGYVKTEPLAPGESQTVTIRYNTTDMSSYYEDGAQWALDAGDYIVRVGNSSRDTEVAARLHLGERTVTEQLANELDENVPATELVSDPANFYSYPTEEAEIAASPRTELDFSGFVAPNNASEFEQTVPIDNTSPYFAIDGSLIGTTEALLSTTNANNWEGSGAAYVPKTGETVRNLATSPSNTLFDVARGTVPIDNFVAGLSVTQLGNIVQGSGIGTRSTATAPGAAGYTTPLYANTLGIPGMTLADGPAGLRITRQINSATVPTQYQYATAWPVGVLLAQTWDTDLMHKVADAIGAEMAEFGVSLWLAPGMNIHRDPLNGRNFEYYSEDPLVTGLTGATMTAGVQANPGVGVTIKHFFANNQEADRFTSDSDLTERASREIYLRGFEIAVKTAQPMAIMTAYNRINTVHAANNYDSTMNVLRGEWGFEGIAMSDWFAMNYSSPIGMMYAGNDIVMPGNNPAQMINATARVAPSIDVSGLPVYTRTNATNAAGVVTTSYSWLFNGLTPNASGAVTIPTTVNSSTDLTQIPRSSTTNRNAINNETYVANAPFASVNAAYLDVTNWLLPATTPGLSNAQKAAITVTDVVRADPADSSSPVVSYTVNVRGNYATTPLNMRLGDMQRSAKNILKVIMQTSEFGQLASQRNQTGITVRPYAAQFGALPQVFTTDTSSIVRNQAGASRPAVSVDTSTAPSAEGWFAGPVNVVVQTDVTADAFVSINGGAPQPYRAPVAFTADGTYHVRAFSVADGVFSADDEITVRIDSALPTATATGANGVLAVTASDALSGVRSVEYSLDGSTWSPYTTPVAIAGAPRTVSYRVTDLAGNQSAAASVAVEAAPPGAVAPYITVQPVASTSAVVGDTVRLSTTATGAPAPAVQWQASRSGVEWTSIAGATGTNYEFAATKAMDGNQYRAVFVNAAGAATSTVSTLDVKVKSVAKAKLSDSTITKSTKGKVKVTVSPTADNPTGTVTVHYGSKTKKATLKASADGEVTVTLPKLKRGTYKVWVTYAGSDEFASSTSSKVTLRVR